MLCSTVKLMLEPEEANRPDFNQLKAQMPPYEQVVHQLKNQPNFLTNYTPLTNENFKKQIGQTDNFMNELNNNYNPNLNTNNALVRRNEGEVQSAPGILNIRDEDLLHRRPDDDLNINSNQRQNVPLPNPNQGNQINNN